MDSKQRRAIAIGAIIAISCKHRFDIADFDAAINSRIGRVPCKNCGQMFSASRISDMLLGIYATGGDTSLLLNGDEHPASINTGCVCYLSGEDTLACPHCSGEGVLSREDALKIFAKPVDSA